MGPDPRPRRPSRATRALLAVTLLASSMVLGPAAPASGSAYNCVTKIDGQPRECIDIEGTARHVDSLHSDLLVSQEPGPDGYRQVLRVDRPAPFKDRVHRTKWLNHRDIPNATFGGKGCPEWDHYYICWRKRWRKYTNHDFSTDVEICAKTMRVNVDGSISPNISGWACATVHG